MLKVLVILILLVVSNSAPAQGIVVLNYHRVISHPVEGASPGPTVVTADVFEEQMRWLKDSNYTTITVSQLAEYMNNPTSSPPSPSDRVIVISFDDGWLDQYENAIPILSKYGFVATFNIVASFPSNRPNYMNWEQIRNLKYLGHEIGSHMEFHLDNPTPEQARSGIIQSKQIIERQISDRIDTIAWPHGIFNPQMIDQAEGVGFTSAQTIDQNWCELGQVAQDGTLSCNQHTGNAAHQPPYLMKRVFVSGTCSLSQFALVVQRGHTDGCLTAETK